MINCIVIDEDISSINVIKHFITSTEGHHLLECFTDAIAASNFLLRHQAGVDLISLDIVMPHMSGLDLIDSHKDIPPIILITSKEK